MPTRNLLFIFVAFWVCYACYTVAVKNRYANLFAEAIGIVENEALHDVPSEQLFQSAMEGMLQDFDRHSSFISGDRFRALNEDIEGEFGGVGIYFEQIEKEGVLVLAVMPGKPADQAGLEAGDMIKSIDGHQTIDQDSRAIRGWMTGNIGETVDVVFERDGESKNTVVRRQKIASQSVRGAARRPDGSWDFAVPGHSDLAYLRLSQFDKISAAEFETVLKELPDTTLGLIVDLRGNGGGLLTAAEAICDMFLEPGLTIVKINGRKGVLERESVSSTKPLVDSTVKVALLLDGRSASASELVAGCLQDHDRAVVIGQQSWGKGTVQNFIPMQKGNSALKITTSSFWRPSGIPIDRFNKQAIETGRWGIYPNDSMEVAQDQLDSDCISQRALFQEIAGLIPEDRRERIIEISTMNFLKRANERLQSNNEQDAESGSAQTDTTTTQPTQKEKQSPQRQIGPEDLQHDRVMEKAIEYLNQSKSLSMDKQAA